VTPPQQPEHHQQQQGKQRQQYQHLSFAAAEGATVEVTPPAGGSVAGDAATNHYSGPKVGAAPAATGRTTPAGAPAAGGSGATGAAVKGAGAEHGVSESVDGSGSAISVFEELCGGASFIGGGGGNEEDQETPSQQRRQAAPAEAPTQPPASTSAGGASAFGAAPSAAALSLSRLLSQGSSLLSAGMQVEPQPAQREALISRHGLLPGADQPRGGWRGLDGRSGTVPAPTSSSSGGAAPAPAAAPMARWGQSSQRRAAPSSGALGLFSAAVGGAQGPSASLGLPPVALPGASPTAVGLQPRLTLERAAPSHAILALPHGLAGAAAAQPISPRPTLPRGLLGGGLGPNRGAGLGHMGQGRGGRQQPSPSITAGTAATAAASLQRFAFDKSGESS
jgi:hypothetical protein